MVKAKQQRMPPCLYGSACKRKGCAYTHPKKHVVNEDVICVPFLTDSCLFGAKCRNRHAAPDEKAALLAKYTSKPCRFGEHCRTEGCLFSHPQPKQQKAQAKSAELDRAARLAHQEKQQREYDEMMAAAAERKMAKMSLQTSPAPPAAPAAVPQDYHPFQVQQQPSTPTQKVVQPVFQSSQTGELSANSPSWVPSMPAPPQQHQQHQQQDPFRAPMGELYHMEAQQQQQQQSNPWGPPPAVAAAASPPQNATTSSSGPLTMAQRLKQSAAAAPPVAQVPTTRTGRQAAPQVIRIPQELWVDSSTRNPDTFHIKDPLERFYQVNASNQRPGVLDLHFQTSLTVHRVLDRVLPSSQPFERVPDSDAGYVWVVTGTGHHTTQRLEKLYDVVQAYLQQHGYSYTIGKDSKGHYGAFYVRLPAR